MVAYGLCSGHERAREPRSAGQRNANPTHWDAAKYESAAGYVAAELGSDVQAIRSSVARACVDFGYWPARDQAGVMASRRFPWHFVSLEDLRVMLERAGFRVMELHCFKRRPVLPEGLVVWLEAFASSILPEVQGAARLKLWRRAAEHARVELCEQGVADGEVWHADYTRLRWLAVRD